jgi:MarR family 2-MHQ and catechol resistance regulon transcriptional repressor
MSTHYSGTPQEILALDTFIKLTRATNSLINRLVGYNTLKQLTSTQFGVLEALMHLGPLSQSDICAKLLKSGGNITLVIDNLEKQNLVKRQIDPADRRITMVSLTGDGEALIQEIFPQHVRAIVNELSSLDTEEQAALGRLCKKLGRGGG